MVTEPYVHLTASEYKLLAALQQAQGSVLTWPDLCEKVLGYYDRRTLHVRLCRLKKKIPGLAVDVVRGIGLRLAVTPPCPHCRGTGFVLFESDEALQ